ncbi:uncharacterized protein EV420DRAFT_137451 [Desarmillaria tabescens]|uniref:Uncharacterized protein n=1 Tax=Armillaria tabescens TaxID=1929756 RepID=A0AA39TS41_ARMTA|nr:uncharacterized protein EV420DRAFT_137451 [Desarmillaria tabescens]KAK0461939.1 hypothetical protein EV420DRAFT_137451 [Desarmillaria tabescens]
MLKPPFLRIPDAPKPPLHIPRTIFYLTCISLINTPLVLAFSLLDYGVLSLWVNPAACVVTIIFHCSVIALSRRKRDIEDPSYFSTMVVCSYLLAVLWFSAMVITVAVLVTYKGDFTVDSLRRYGLHVSIHTQRLQCVLAAMEFLLMTGIGVSGHLLARKEGDPASWRPPADVKVVHQPVVIQTTFAPTY